jgi:hypothetical protein
MKIEMHSTKPQEPTYEVLTYKQLKRAPISSLPQRGDKNSTAVAELVLLSAVSRRAEITPLDDHARSELPMSPVKFA